MAIETYHHWKVLSSGFEGVCTEFDRAALESALEPRGNTEACKADYLQVRELEAL